MHVDLIKGVIVVEIKRRRRDEDNMEVLGNTGANYGLDYSIIGLDQSKNVQEVGSKLQARLTQ